MEQNEVRERVLDILSKTHLMSLAVVDDGGPWVSDVIFLYDEDFTIYWLSDIDARHSRALESESAAAAAITFTHKSKEPNEGIQLSGLAKKVDGPRMDLSTKHYAKRGKPAPEKDICDEGESWYELRPSKIELIYEPVLGYQKVELTLPGNP